MWKFWLRDKVTTIFGTVAGVPEILQGLETGNKIQLMQGVALVLLGLMAKDSITRKTL